MYSVRYFFFFFRSMQGMTLYRQSGTLNFIKSYVLNNWEYIFFPHRKVKKEWCVFFFPPRMLVALFYS